MELNLEIFLLAFALSMDSVAVAMANGAKKYNDGRENDL